MPQINQQQRYIILDLLNKGYSKNKIEIKRNCDQRSGEYKPELAQKKYEDRLKSRDHFSKLKNANLNNEFPFSET